MKQLGFFLLCPAHGWRSNLWASCLCGLLLAAPPVYVRAEEPADFKNSPVYKALHPKVSTDTQIVSIHFGNAIYDIPRNYLVGATQPSADNAYANFTIMVLLPDLSPRTPENAGQFDELGWNDQLRALFQFGTHIDPAQTVIDRILSLQRRNPDDFQILPSGLNVYRGLTADSEDMYVKAMDSGPFYYRCGTMRSVPWHVCTVYEQFFLDVEVTYSFGTKYIDSAYKIDMALHDLVRSFLRKQ